MTAVLTMLAAGAAAAAPPDNAPLALLLLIIAAFGWFGLRALVRQLRARKTETIVRGSFGEFAREALVNAAKVDGRIAAAERTAIAAALAEITGAPTNTAALEASYADARLSKNELVDYLAMRSGAFRREQKTALLKALLSVFVADGVFDENEHAALVDYTEAIGFDREAAPGLLHSLTRGNII